ncbi:MAG: DUF2059 domain-containing protein [Verrucomicrobiales bacterium]
MALHAAGTEPTTHEKLAEKLMGLMNRREVMLEAFTATTEPALLQMPEAKRPAIRKLFKEFAESIADAPELKTRLTALYKESFTEAELSDMLAFYETPTGKKALEKIPALFQKGAAIGQDLAQKKQAELERELQKILRNDAGQ